MPLGAFRLNGLAKFTLTAAAEVIRVKKSITAIGNAQVDTAQSKFGGASALFDGSGDYIRILGSSDFQFSTNQDFTIEFWARMATVTNTRIFWTLFDSTTARAVLYTSSGQLSLYAPALGGQTLGDFPSVNTWYHFAISRSGNTTKVFYNGTETYSTTTSWTATSDRLVLGTDNESTVANPYSGHLDEIRVSNVARYTANFTPSTTAFVNDENTLFLMHCDGTDAQTYFEDDNGVRSKIGVVSYNGAALSTTQSKFGASSLSLDGTNDQLVISSSYNTYFSFTGDFCIEMWARSTSSPVTHQLFTNWAGGILIGWVSSQFRVYINSSLIVSATLSGYSNDTWYHYAITRNGSDVKVFWNGTQVGSTGTASGTVNMADWTGIGCNTDNKAEGSGIQIFPGYIDELRVSNTSRYTTGFTPSTTPFVNDENTLLLLHMDGTNGTTYFEDDNGVRQKKELVVQGSCQIDTAQYKFGSSSMLTDGSLDALKTTGYNLTGAWTFEGWFRINSAVYEVPLFRIHNSSNTFQANYGILNSKIYTYQGGTTQGTTTLSTGVWYHFAFVRSGTTISLYLNGTREATRSYSSPPDNAILYLSGTADASNYSLNGWSDEIRISSTARYTDTTFTVPTAPFVNDDDTLLLLHFDGTDAATVFADDNGVTPNWEY